MITKIKLKAGVKALAICAIIGLTAAAFSGCSKEKGESASTEEKMASPEEIAKAKEHYDKGVQFSIKGQVDDALKEYDASIKINPNSPEPYNNLGFIYFDRAISNKEKTDMVMLDKAIENQQKALSLNPGLANAHYGLAQALEKKGDKANAINSWRAFMQLSEPHSRWWMQAKAHIDFLEGKQPATMQKTGKPAGHK